MLHYNAREFIILFNIRGDVNSWVKVIHKIHKHDLPRTTMIPQYLCQCDKKSFSYKSYLWCGCILVLNKPNYKIFHIILWVQVSLPFTIREQCMFLQWMIVKSWNAIWVLADLEQETHGTWQSVECNNQNTDLSRNSYWD